MVIPLLQLQNSILLSPLLLENCASLHIYICFVCFSDFFFLCFIIYLRLPSLPFPPSCHLCHLFLGYPHCHVRPGVRWGPVSLERRASRGRCRGAAALLPSAWCRTAARTHSGRGRPLPSAPTSSALRTHTRTQESEARFHGNKHTFFFFFFLRWRGTRRPVVVPGIPLFIFISPFSPEQMSPHRCSS